MVLNYVFDCNMKNRNPHFNISQQIGNDQPEGGHVAWGTGSLKLFSGVLAISDI